MIQLAPIIEHMGHGDYALKWLAKHKFPTFAEAWRAYPWLSFRIRVVKSLYAARVPGIDKVCGHMLYNMRNYYAGDVWRYLQTPSVVKRIEKCLISYAKANGCAVVAE